MKLSQQVHYLALLLTVILSCKKKDDITPLKPVLQYGIYNYLNESNVFGLDTSAVYRIAKKDVMSITNLSTNVISYHWDFGDGRTSNEKEPVLFYEFAGEYKLTLNAQTAEGKKFSLTKSVLVVNPVLHSIEITSINWNSNFSHLLNWPIEKKAGIYVEIMELPIDAYPKFTNGKFIGSVIYRSEIIKDISMGKADLKINVRENILLDIDKITKLKYGINLHAVDGNIDYILASNWGSGVGSIFNGTVSSNKFRINSSFNGNEIELTGEYR